MSLNGFLFGAFAAGSTSGIKASKIRSYISSDPEGSKLYNELKNKWSACGGKPTDEVKHLRKEFIKYLKKIPKSELKEEIDISLLEEALINEDIQLLEEKILAGKCKILDEGFLNKVTSLFKKKEKVPRRVVSRAAPKELVNWLRNDAKLNYLADIAEFNSVAVIRMLKEVGAFDKDSNLIMAPALAVEFILHYYEGEKEFEIYDLLFDDLYDEINGVEGNLRKNPKAVSLLANALDELVLTAKKIIPSLTEKVNKQEDIDFNVFEGIIHPYYIKLQTYVDSLESPDNLGKQNLERIYNYRKANGLLANQVLKEDTAQKQSLMIRCASKFNDKQCDKIISSIERKMKTQEEKSAVRKYLGVSLDEKREFIKSVYNKNRENNQKLANSAEERLEAKGNATLEEGWRFNLQVVGLVLFDLAVSLFIMFFTSIPFIILPMLSLTAIAKAEKYKDDHGYFPDSLKDLRNE